MLLLELFIMGFFDYYDANSKRYIEIEKKKEKEMQYFLKASNFVWK